MKLLILLTFCLGFVACISKNRVIIIVPGESGHAPMSKSFRSGPFLLPSEEIGPPKIPNILRSGRMLPRGPSYGPAPEPSYGSAPEPTYAPEPSYETTPEPSYETAPGPTYVPEPSYKPAPRRKPRLPAWLLHVKAYRERMKKRKNLRKKPSPTYNEPKTESTDTEPEPEPSYIIPERKIWRRPSYDSAPEPSYVPAPEPSYAPAPEPSYDPAPEPSYDPAPEPSYVSAPEPSYRGNNNLDD